MTTEEIGKIKEYQKEFKKLFKRRLEVDWHSMKGLRRMITFRHTDEEDYIDPEQLLIECANKYGASIDKIKSRKERLQAAGSSKERRAVEDYCKVVIESRVNIKEAARLINRDRTLIYHYACYKQ